jgi:hypothetical protein
MPPAMALPIVTTSGRTPHAAVQPPGPALIVCVSSMIRRRIDRWPDVALARTGMDAVERDEGLVDGPVLAVAEDTSTYGRCAIARQSRSAQRFASVAVRAKLHSATPKRRPSSSPTQAASSVGSMRVAPPCSPKRRCTAATVAGGECPPSRRCRPARSRRRRRRRRPRSSRRAPSPHRPGDRRPTSPSTSSARRSRVRRGRARTARASADARARSVRARPDGR